MHHSAGVADAGEVQGEAECRSAQPLFAELMFVGAKRVGEGWPPDKARRWGTALPRAGRQAALHGDETQWHCHLLVMPRFMALEARSLADDVHKRRDVPTIVPVPRRGMRYFFRTMYPRYALVSFQISCPAHEGPGHFSARNNQRIFRKPLESRFQVIQKNAKYVRGAIRRLDRQQFWTMSDQLQKAQEFAV